MTIFLLISEKVIKNIKNIHPLNGKRYQTQLRVEKKKSSRSIGNIIINCETKKGKTSDEILNFCDYDHNKRTKKKNRKKTEPNLTTTA